MSDTTQTVTVEEVKPVVLVVPEVPVPDVLKADVEKVVKDVLKAAIMELLEELRKPAVRSKLDKDGDGVVSATEVKEAVKEQVQKLGCAPSCTIS